MGFSYAEQQRQIAKFLKAEVKNLEKATEIVMRESAGKLVRETKKQLRKNFKIRKDSNFAKAVKAYNLPHKGALGPASYVRLGIPWIGVFEEGETVQGDPWIRILLPQGEALGFKRKDTPLYQQMQQEGRLFTRQVRDGFIVYLRPATQGKPIPIYKVQKSPVRVPKRLEFYAASEAIADDMPDAISNLMS